MPQNSPLTAKDLESIKSNLNQLAIAKEQIKLARSAGIDVTEQAKQVDEQRTQLLQIKNTYFSGS